MRGEQHILDVRLGKLIYEWASNTDLAASDAPSELASDAHQEIDQPEVNTDLAKEIGEPRRQRIHYLHRFIVLAQDNSTAPLDMTAVMMELQKIADEMATGPERGHPFLGATSGGVHYQKDDQELLEFTKRQLTDYLMGKNLNRSRKPKVRPTSAQHPRKSAQVREAKNTGVAVQSSSLQSLEGR